VRRTGHRCCWGRRMAGGGFCSFAEICPSARLWAYPPLLSGVDGPGACTISVAGAFPCSAGWTQGASLHTLSWGAPAASDSPARVIASWSGRDDDVARAGLAASWSYLSHLRGTGCPPHWSAVDDLDDAAETVLIPENMADVSPGAPQLTTGETVLSF
jgi:hypothetical protein